MTLSSFGMPYCAGKEMHLLTLETLIGACSKLESFVVNFITSIDMYYYNHFIVALDFHSRISSNIFFLSNSNVLACRNLGQHILAFDGDQEVFNKVFFFFFFKAKDPKAKNCQNALQILNPQSINVPRLIWIVSKFNLSTKFAFRFPLLNSDILMTPLPMWCKGIFSSLRRIPFFAHDDFFPSPPSSPQLPSYVEDYVQILVACPFPFCSVFPHTYNKFCDVLIDFEVVER